MIRSFAIGIAFLVGCSSPPCSPGQTRCVGDSAQVCLANGSWREFENCSDVASHSGGVWQCGASPSVDGGVSCVGNGYCSATDPTPQMVQDFWTFMASVYGSKQIDKTNSAAIDVVGDFLQLIGVQDEQTFLSRFTTTIGTRIYTPFDVGTTTPEYSLWAEMIICVHEHKHVVQFENEGIDYVARYLASGADRADYEAEAYRTAAELNHWRYGTVDSAQGLANHLTNYNCTPAEIDNAREIIQLSEDTIGKGGLVSDVTATAIEWLEANAPALKVRG
jgi:hypothetical protein